MKLSKNNILPLDCILELPITDLFYFLVFLKQYYLFLRSF